MNSKFSTLTQKLVVFSLFLALVFGSLGTAGATPASAQELPPQTPAGEPVHYIVDEAGNVRISPVPPARTANAPAATSPNAACANAPTLVSPANGSLLNTLIPELQYISENEPNADWLNVAWSTTPDFSSWGGHLTTWPGDTSWKMFDNLEPATTYYWRAWFVCDEEAGPSSSVWSFTTGSGGTVPAATTLLSPVNGSIVVEPATFEWQPVSGAVEYILSWSEDSFSGYSSMRLDETSFTNWWLEAGSEYEWWVKAGNDYAYSDPSASWTFELIAPTFPDVPTDHWAWAYTERLANAGITSGFPDGTYRPENNVTRAEIAVFLLKGMNFPTAYTPPQAAEFNFSDIESHWGANWIEALRASGITGGFSDGTYRPEEAVTRGQMAVFLLKALNGPDYTPPAAAATFDDTEGHWASNWIEALRAAGLTSGYSDGTFRPDSPVTRAEMAVFIVNAFGLP